MDTCASTNIISLLCTLIVAMTSIISSAVVLKSSKHNIMASSITSHRMKWIQDVRNIMTNFCEEFRKNGANTDKLKALRTHLFLYLRNGNNSYEPLVITVNRCCNEMMNAEVAALALEDLISSTQYVLATVWSRVKIEGIKGEEDDHVIDEIIKSKYQKPTLNLDRYF